MSWATSTMIPLALMGNGMAAGGMIIAAIGGAPLFLRLPTEQYVPIHHFLVGRFDPFMPICAMTALLMDIGLIFAVDADSGARPLYVIAVLLLLGAMYVSLTKNVPINKFVAGLDPNALPPDFDKLDGRVRWRNWNLVRTVLVVTSLALNATAVGLLV